jgi:hypothetical protein
VGFPRSKRAANDIGASKPAGLVRRIARDAARFDRSGFKPGYAVRCTAGVAAPLLIALVAGHAPAGVPAAIGALSAGFASRQGVYRTRAAAMLWTATAMAVSAFAGSTTSAIPVLNIAAAGLWGLALGIVASLGTTANVVGLNACLALAIFSQFRYGPVEAANVAGLVLAGGAFQTLLLVSIWPAQRFTAERAVLAKAYRTLAAYADTLRTRDLRPPDQRPFSTLGATFADTQPFARRGDIAAFEVLLDEAERIRATLGALAIDRYMLGARVPPGDAAVIDLGSAACTVLGVIAAALEAGRPPAGAADAWDALDGTMAGVERDGGQRLVEDARALLGQLRAAWRAASSPGDDPVAPGPGRHVPLFRTSAAEALQTLRANCTFAPSTRNTVSGSGRRSCSPRSARTFFRFSGDTGFR